MDLTISVMLPPRGDSTYTRSANTKFSVLSPIAVYEREPTKVITNPVLGYLRVTGCPVKSAAELAERICSSEEQDFKRVWQADTSLLPERVRDALLRDRRATLTWEEFSAMYEHRTIKVRLSSEIIART